MAVTRILCIAPFGDYGGSEMVMMRVLRSLDASVEVRLVVRGLRVPLLWMKHDHFYDGWPARAVAGRCDHVAVVSEAMAEQFSPRLDGRLSVIYPGVRLEPSSQDEDTEPLIVAVGRL